jgi:hypothetical protein
VVRFTSYASLSNAHGVISYGISKKTAWDDFYHIKVAIISFDFNNGTYDFIGTPYSFFARYLRPNDLFILRIKLLWLNVFINGQHANFTYLSLTIVYRL